MGVFRRQYRSERQTADRQAGFQPVLHVPDAETNVPDAPSAKRHRLFNGVSSVETDVEPVDGDTLKWSRCRIGKRMEVERCRTAWQLETPLLSRPEHE